MAETASADPTGTPQPNGADTSPVAGVISQYVKDMSFENPGAPGIFQKQGQPGFDVQFNIGSNQVGDDAYEVALKIEVRAEIEGQTAFLVDLTYGGLFGLRNIPQEHIEPFLLGEAPRILFPFARRVLADAVRDGGFQPLMLEPIDFNALYLQQRAERDQQNAPAGEGVGQA